MNDSLKIETSYWSVIPLKYEELFKFAEEATDEIERLQEEIRKLKEPVKDENMTDIVEKLKTSTQWWHSDCDMKMEAAHEIERLRNQKKELLDMVLENLENEYPEYKLKYERLNRRYKSEREYLIEEFRDD